MRVALLAYVHPVIAGLTVALLAYVGSLGLRARSDPRNARRHLTRHALLAPFMFGLMLVNWAGGLLSTWLLRRELDLGASMHLRFGVALVLALLGSVLTSRWLDRPPAALLHPWFGAAAMLLAAAQVFFGFQITP